MPLEPNLSAAVVAAIRKGYGVMFLRGSDADHINVLVAPDRPADVPHKVVSLRAHEQGSIDLLSVAVQELTDRLGPKYVPPSPKMVDLWLWLLGGHRRDPVKRHTVYVLTRDDDQLRAVSRDVFEKVDPDDVYWRDKSRRIPWVASVDGIEVRFVLATELCTYRIGEDKVWDFTQE